MDLIDKRQIRVFISSTFQNMNLEREYLIKKIFPEMRQKAYERNVSLVEVDLRWGITEEDSKNGKVIDICFDEIDNSIPFFIGIIGNRYGWCPDNKDISPNESRHYDCISKYINEQLSITEMEILYGAIERKEPIYASFFFNSETEDENNIDYPQKLNNLKKMIKGDCRYPYFEYSTKEELGNKVKDYFIKLLDKLFPQEKNLSEVELIKHSQTMFMKSLYTSYIADNKRFEIIDNFIKDPHLQQLLIVGDSGVGKSAFLAEWVHRNQHKKDILYYSVGVGGNNSDKDTVLKQISLLIKDKYNISSVQDISFEDTLSTISDKQLIIIIDAFNQIELEEKEQDLEWFPPTIGNIKFIITTTKEDDTEFFNSQHINTRLNLSKINNTQEYIFNPFPSSIRRDIVNTILKHHGKNINPILVNRIINNNIFDNCLALRILIDELIICSNDKNVTDTLNRYIKFNSVSSFINSVLERYEQDYGQLLVRKILTLLAISENGLSEAELKDIINKEYSIPSSTNSILVTQLQWSQFYCAFKNNISIRKGGLLGFAHQLVKSSILNKYVTNNDSFTKSLRYLIIDILKDDKSPRAYIEIAHQYLCLKDYMNLHNVITNHDTFYYLTKDHWGRFSNYWIELCVYSNEQYPLMDIVSTWQGLPNEHKSEIYNKIELLLAAIIVEQQGCWPPANCPIEFITMQEQCIPLQTTKEGFFHYSTSAGYAYLNIPDKQEHALKLLSQAIDMVENSSLNEWDHKSFEQIAKCYYSVAHLYDLQGCRDKEIYYLERFIKPCENYYGVFHLKSLQANFISGYKKYEYNNYIGAIPNFQKSLQIAERLNDYEYIYQSSRGLVECYSTILKDEKLKSKYNFDNQENHLKYIYYNEKMVSALKIIEDK